MLDYIALGIAILVILVILVAFVSIADIPYRIARKRNHPHRDAIHVGCWVSLITLGALWPLILLWALVVPNPSDSSASSDDAELARLRRENADLRAQRDQSSKA